MPSPCILTRVSSPLDLMLAYVLMLIPRPYVLALMLMPCSRPCVLAFMLAYPSTWCLYPYPCVLTLWSDDYVLVLIPRPYVLALPCSRPCVLAFMLAYPSTLYIYPRPSSLCPFPSAYALAHILDVVLFCHHPDVYSLMPSLAVVPLWAWRCTYVVIPSPWYSCPYALGGGTAILQAVSYSNA